MIQSTHITDFVGVFECDIFDKFWVCFFSLPDRTAYTLSESKHGNTGSKSRTRNSERAHSAVEEIADPVSELFTQLILHFLLSGLVGVVPLAHLGMRLENSVAEHGMEAPELCPAYPPFPSFPIAAGPAIGHHLSDLLGSHAGSDHRLDLIS